MDHATERPLATTAEVAAFLATTPRALSKRRREGRGPRYVRDGRRVLYRWADVETYINRNIGAEGDRDE